MTGLPTATPFAAADALRNGRAIALLQLDAALTAITAATSGVFSKPAHGLLAGDGVIYKAGTDLAGLTVGELYYVIDPATDTLKLSATRGGSAVAISAAGTAITLQPVQIHEAYQLNDTPEQSDNNLELPDLQGVMHDVRTGLGKVAEKWTFDVYAIRRLVKIFAGALTGRRTGYATLYLPDVDDTAGAVALKSEEWFPCTVVRDGGIQHGGGKDSKAVIRISSNKQTPVTWTPTASLT